MKGAARGGRRRLTAFITSRRLQRQILAQLGLDATGHLPSPRTRTRPNQDRFDLPPDDLAGEP